MTRKVFAWISLGVFALCFMAYMRFMWLLGNRVPISPLEAFWLLAAIVFEGISIVLFRGDVYKPQPDWKAIAGKLYTALDQSAAATGEQAKAMGEYELAVKALVSGK